MSKRLTVVTGGGRGIGAAVAVRIAGDGHDVVIGYARDADAAEATADRVRAAGASCRTFRADVADPDGVDALFDAAAEWGTLTGLVNNAGVTLHLADLADTPVDVVRRTIDVNLTGAVLVARRAVRDMVDGGTIVNVSSAAATLGSPHEYVYYAAAKAGLDAFTVGLASEVASRGIRVNAVAPGLVRTEIHATAGDAGRLERIAGTVPAGRAGEPEEIAEAVAWLLGDACPYTTGAVLRVAGGR